MAQFVIMSAFRQGLTQTENLTRHHQLDATLGTIMGTHPKLTLGSYVEEGTQNPGIKLGVRIAPSTQTSFEKVVQIAIRLAEHYGQDSILVVDHGGQATLVYPDGRADEGVGNWTKVSQAEALRSPYWTNISGSYYMAVA